MANSERRLLEAEEVADLLSLTREEVDWLVATNQLAEIHICRQIRFDSDDVVRLLESYKRTQLRRKSNAAKGQIPPG